MAFLSIIDRKRCSKKNLGPFNPIDFTVFIKACNAIDLKCLCFVDHYVDVYFNKKQMYQIKNEINILKLDSTISPEIIQNFEDGVSIALKNNWYVMVSGD